MLWLLKFLFPQVLGVTNLIEGLYGVKDSPDLPDYQGLTKQDAQSNMQMAVFNQMLNRPNEITPYGTRTWEQTGTMDIPGVGGGTAGSGLDSKIRQALGLPPATGGGGGFSVPQFTSKVEFSPHGQQMFDMQEAVKQGLLSSAGTSLGQVQGALSKPVDFSQAPALMGEADLNANRDAVTNALYERSMRLLRPQFDTERRGAEADLINRGFSMGNEGYTRELDNVSRRQGAQEATVRDTAIVAGGQEQSRIQDLAMNQRRQAIQEMLTARQQPLAELSSLMTGGAPTPPNFQPFSATANAQGTDLLGAGKAQGQAELARYGLDTERMNAIHNGIMDVWKQAMGGMGGGMGMGG